MERIKEVFTGNAFEVFALTLEGKSVEEIGSVGFADEFDLRVEKSGQVVAA